MDVVGKETFGALIDAGTFPAVSIYLTTHRAGPEIQQDPIRLKNLVVEARQLAVGSGVRGPEADRLLAPISDLIADAGFWQHQEGGLAVFRSADRFDVLRLPAPFREHASVAHTFHVKPLLQVLTRGERCYVLALSREHVRLLWVSRFRVGDVDLGEIPTDISEALQHEDLERQLQVHQSGVKGRGSPTAVFHGQGMGKETSDKRLERFFRTIDRGVSKMVEPDVPLVLAGVEYLLPIYRSVSRHPLILQGEVTGSADGIKDEDLRERAWGIARSFFEQEKDAALLTFTSGAARTEKTVEGVVRAAIEGRVDSLFVDATATVWGTIAETSVTRHDAHRKGDRDLLDLAIVETWQHGGSVYLGGPEGTVAAAVLRY